MNNISGPDVSFYQDSPATPQQIDFAKMRTKTEFVIIRAGQGSWSDPDVGYNMIEAKKAGLARGSYWFYDDRYHPVKQAELWKQTLNGDVPECGLWADFEKDYLGPYNQEHHFRAFMDAIKRLYPKSPVGIYTRASYWWPHIKEDPAYWHQYMLWIAHYRVVKPLVPAPWGQEEWLFWQYTDQGDGLAYGAESREIDLNWFNGDVTKFRETFNIATPPTPQPVPSQAAYLVMYDADGKPLDRYDKRK